MSRRPTNWPDVANSLIFAGFWLVLIWIGTVYGGCKW